MTGYIRQDVSNNIANGAVINADDLDAEFNALATTFTAASGHNHDGTTGNGAPVTVVGPAQDVIISSTAMSPKANNLYDLGTTTNKWKNLYYAGLVSGLDATVSGTVLVGYVSTNGAYKLQVNSQIFATSATVATSDARYKENVEPITGALDLVEGLNPVSFSWKQHPVHNFDRQPTIGFLAQEVQSALQDKPWMGSIVRTNSYETPSGETEEFLGLAEGPLVSLLTAALKEAYSTIKQLDARVTALESK
jgi:hypothetical protein